MLKKIAVTALISGFAIASFAQAGASASTPAKLASPAASEQKADTPTPAKHMKHVRHHRHIKAAAKADTTPAAVASVKK